MCREKDKKEGRFCRLFGMIIKMRRERDTFVSKDNLSLQT